MAYQEGASLKDLSRSYAINIRTVMDHLDRHGIARRGNVKLRPDQISDACQLYGEGWSTIELGNRYGVSDTTVGNVLKRAGTQMRPCKGKHHTPHKPPTA